MIMLLTISRHVGGASAQHAAGMASVVQDWAGAAKLATSFNCLPLSSHNDPTVPTSAVRQTNCQGIAIQLSGTMDGNKSRKVHASPFR